MEGYLIFGRDMLSLGGLCYLWEGYVIFGRAMLSYMEGYLCCEGIHSTLSGMAADMCVRLFVSGFDCSPL